MVMTYYGLDFRETVQFLTPALKRFNRVK